MSAQPIVLGITIRADGSAQVTGEINRVQAAVTGAGSAAQSSTRQFAQMAAAMASAEQAAAAIHTRLASANAIYDAQVAWLTLSTRAYRAYQLQMDGLHPSQIRHIQDLEAARAASAQSSTAISGLSTVMGAFGVTVGLIGLAALAKDIVNTNREMESLRAQLKALTGSAEEAQRTFEFITRFATDTPFEVNGLTKSFVMLQNFGIKPTEQVMSALTNQAAKLGGSQEILSGITLALGQAYSKGKLQAEDMNQLIERGVPVYKLLAEVTGKNTSELQDMSGKGEITRDIIDQLIVKMGELASGSNAAAMETLNGKISNLADAWHQFEDALMNDKSEGFIKSIVSSITETLNILTRNMSDTLDAQIAQAQARVKTFDGLGAVGSFVSDLSGYDINIEKNKIDGLKRLKEKQDNAHKEVEINKDRVSAIAQTNEWLNDIETTDAEAAAKRLKKHEKDSSTTSNALVNDAKRKAEAIAKGIADELASLDDQHSKLMLSGRDYYAQSEALKAMSPAVKAFALAQWDVNKALANQKSSSDAANTELTALKDKYDQLTLSASAYYAKTLGNKGLSTEQAAPLIQQNSLNIKTEISNKKTDDARAALEAYNKSLDDAHVKTSDLGAVTSAIFDSALGGIHAMAGAYDSMVNSIAANTKALAENAKMQKLNETTVDPAEKAANVAKYAKEEATLNNANIKLQLTGASQIAGAAAKMFDQKSAAAKAFHGIEVGLSIVRLAMDAKEIISSMTKTTVKVAEGASTMFAQSGWAGFAGVAAMLAVMAGLGVATSGGSGGASEPPPPATSTGTGTVLGDKSATSESVTKTWDLLKSIHASEYAELRGINTGINNLVSGITGTITAVFQGGGLITRAVSSTASALGFSSSKQSNYASGLNIGSISVANAMAGGKVAGNQFDTVKTDKSSWWGLSKSTSYDTYYSALDSKVTSSISMVFKSMGEVMTDAAKLLGGNLKQKVSDYIIPAMNIDLNGLSGADAAKKLNGVISAALDIMATSVFGAIIGQYQKLGEGMLETAMRIVSEVAVVKDALATSGLSLANNAIAISDALVQAAGGLAEFQKQFQAYFDKFYSDTEKQAASYKSLSAALLTGLEVLPQTRDGYRKLIEGLDLANALDRERYSLLMSLSAAADTYYTSLEAQTKTYTDAIATAKSNLATAYKTESDAITATINKLSSFVASLKNLKDSLTLGNLSTGTPLDKYNAARQQVGDSYNTIQGGAGTTTAGKAAYDAAVSSINSKLTTFLDTSKTYNASGSGYTADYQQVMNMIDSMGLAATAQQTDAEKQLAQLIKSVDGLITINTSVLSVRDALAGVTAAIGALQVLQADRDKVDAAAKQAVTQAGIDRAAADKATAVAAARAAEYAAARTQVTQLVAAYQAHPSAAGSEAVNSYLRSIAGRFNESYNPNPGVSAEGMWTLTPKFAAGGAHTGGWRIVGENGSELEHTGSSQIFSNSQSKAMLGGGNSQEIILELRALRAEVTKLRSEQRDNTGALIQSNYDANDLAANKVVTGTQDTAKQSAWANNSKAVIA